MCESLVDHCSSLKLLGDARFLRHSSEGCLLVGSRSLWLLKGSAIQSGWKAYFLEAGPFLYAGERQGAGSEVRSWL